MDPVAPQPVIASSGAECWISYRTTRHDHFAVLRFSGVRSCTSTYPSDEYLPSHTAMGGRGATRGWQVIDHPELAVLGLRRWIAGFHDVTFDITAAGAEVVVRAIEARDSAAAMSMVRA